MTDLLQGANGRYLWLQAPVNASNVGLPVSKLLLDCPGVMKDRYVVITSLDSGPLQLTEQQLDAGWQRQGRLAVSPKISSATAIPFEWFDEWFIFDEPSAPDEVEVFVNYGTFSLADPNPTVGSVYIGSGPEVSEQLVASAKPLRERFWTQLEEIKPVTYVANGNCFLFVTSHAEIFECVTAALKSY